MDPFGIIDANDKANWMMLGQWLQIDHLVRRRFVAGAHQQRACAATIHWSLVSSSPRAMNVSYDGTAHTFETRYAACHLLGIAYAMGAAVCSAATTKSPCPILRPVSRYWKQYWHRRQLFADQSLARGPLYAVHKATAISWGIAMVNFPSGQPGPTARARGHPMQGDGNLVMLDGDGNCVGRRTPGATTVRIWSCRVMATVIYRPDGVTIWASGTNVS
jgi:hypothetical protein